MVTLGSPLMSGPWERSDFSFSCTLYTFELTKVFTRVYQVLSFFLRQIKCSEVHFLHDPQMVLMTTKELTARGLWRPRFCLPRVCPSWLQAPDTRGSLSP